MHSLTHELGYLVDKLIVQAGRKIYFIEVDKITYIEACNYYSLIHEGDKTFIVRQALKDFEKSLCGKSFLRIHRSIILNINIFRCIESVKDTLFVRTTIGKDFKVSRYRKSIIRDKILSGSETPGCTLEAAL